MKIKLAGKGFPVSFFGVVTKTELERIMKKGTISEGMIEKVEFPNKGTIHTEDG